MPPRPRLAAPRAQPWAAVLAVLLAGCGGGSPASDAGPLTVGGACETFVATGQRCGTYVPGSFGGTDRAGDVAGCTALVDGRDERCQTLFTDLVVCGTAGCGDAVAHCQPLLDAFTTTCRP